MQENTIKQQETKRWIPKDHNCTYRKCSFQEKQEKKIFVQNCYQNFNMKQSAD